eukprot:gnl/MRDRNA2_/MRDRNA2_37657_c0_seq2.p1 gnl/MRDRNA2_/MRDRNA2_37657_c0~~gnl/MRDRNA2_/MRDRNA2_37657_c0_seq2.p1  ORF type:complete len:178 (-),score=25.29 gnl/MRDRNA2_/MRDRNA2_37657_c0_seq2:78-611(-)
MLTGYYDLLGIKSDASSTQIRQAYRCKLLETHPDKGGSSKEFQAVKLAYEALIDDQSRQAYNHALSQGLSHAEAVNVCDSIGGSKIAAQAKQRNHRRNPCKQDSGVHPAVLWPPPLPVTVVLFIFCVYVLYSGPITFLKTCAKATFRILNFAWLLLSTMGDWLLVICVIIWLCKQCC